MSKRRKVNEREPRMSAWRGHDNYECRLCAFATLDEDGFVEHMKLAHPPLEIMDGGLADEAVTTTAEDSNDGDSGS